MPQPMPQVLLGFFVQLFKTIYRIISYHAFNTIQFYLYRTTSQQQLHRGTLYCKEKTPKIIQIIHLPYHCLFSAEESCVL